MVNVRDITLTQKNIKPILLGGTFAQQSNVAQVMSWIKVVIEDNIMTITSANQENQIKVRTELSQPCVNCSFCTNFFDIKDALKLIKDKEFKLHLSVETYGSAEIIHERGKLKFPIYSTETFPIAQSDNISDSISVDSSKLASMITKAIRFCSKEQTQPIFTGVNFVISYSPEYDKTKLQISSTNAQYLYVDKIKLIENVIADTNLILSTTSLNAIAPILEYDENTIINISEKHAFFLIGKDIEVSCRRMDGKYPDIMQVIPKVFNHTIKVNVNELTLALKRLLISSGDSYSIKIECNETMKLSVDNVVLSKSGIEEIPCECDNPLDITLNINFLMLVLNSISSKDVTIKAVTNINVIVFYEDDDSYKNQLIGLMPISPFVK